MEKWTNSNSLWTRQWLAWSPSPLFHHGNAEVSSIYGHKNSLDFPSYSRVANIQSVSLTQTFAENGDKYQQHQLQYVLPYTHGE